MKSGVAGVFAVMAGKLASLQLAQGEKYKKQAEKNVISTEFLAPARGLIVDRKGRRLAQNRRAWELRVYPNRLPDEKTQPEERRRVIDTLISAMQIEDTLVAQYAGIREGTQDAVFSRVAAMLGYTGDTAQDYISYWTRALKNEIYLNLTPNGGLSLDDAARFRAAINELPGVQVMNRLDWQIENQWTARLPIIVAKDVPRETALKLQANRTYLPGVELDDSALVREYFGGEVMSHVIGYVQPIQAALVDDPRWMDENGSRVYDQNDVIGAVGIEYALEKELRGVRGRQDVERDALGVQTRVMPNSIVRPKDGKNIWLTIDLELQQVIGKALEKQIHKAVEIKQELNEKRLAEGRDREWKLPDSGAVVAYDPRNGQIHAMVSYPFYDNQLFISGISQRKWEEYTAEDGPKAFVNRCTNGEYPPGSTFKVFLAMSALDRGSLHSDDIHTCTGAITVPNTLDYTQSQPFACWTGWNDGAHGPMDLYNAIEQSCDVYFYNVAPEREQPVDSPDPVFYWNYHLLDGAIVSDTKHIFDGEGINPIVEDMTEKFWFGRRTEIEISENAGLFPTPQRKIETTGGEGWTVGDSLNVSIGQGDFRATPLQMAFNTGIIAANGEVRTPRLVMKMTDDLPRSVAVATEQAEATPLAVGTPEVMATPSAEPSPSATEVVESTRPDSILGMKTEALEIVQEGMRRVVQGQFGTARKNTDDTTKWPLLNPPEQLEDGSIEMINVAGKTGTAEFGFIDDIGAADSHAWFTCYAPIEDPEIAVAVIIEAGGEGSVVAVPVADEVLRAYFELTGRRERGLVLDKEPLPS